MVNATVTEHATCNNDNDGVITVSASGGHEDDYYYGVANTYLGAVSMSVGAMDPMAAGTPIEIQAAAGTYYVVVYDDVCDDRAISEKLVVNSFDPVTAADTALAITDIQCYGDSVGVIEINTATGGSGQLVYTLWLDSDTVAGYVEVTDTVFTNLKAGVYTVEVTDMGTAGCDGTTIENIVVNQPAELMWEIDTDDISCNGAADGVLYISAEGGNGSTPMFKLGDLTWKPLLKNFELKSTKDNTVEWYKEVVITEPGTYTVSLMDSLLQCPAGSKTFTIVEPEPLMVVAKGTDDTTACGDLDDGMIEVTITGGKLDVSGYEIEVAGVDTVSIPMDSVHTFYNVDQELMKYLLLKLVLITHVL